MFAALVYVMSKNLVYMFTGLGHVIISNTGAMFRHLTMVYSGLMGSWSLNMAISWLILSCAETLALTLNIIKAICSWSGNMMDYQ